MASKLNTSEYSYCSAKFRALENRLLNSEKMRVLLECPTYAELIGKLTEYGVELLHDESGEVDIEGSLQKMFEDACLEVDTQTPIPEMYRFLRYPYDCNNLKACIKCNIKSISPDSMLYGCGAFSADEAKLASDGEFSEYPENMAAAIAEAQQAYAKTKNPQNIDLILDKACYADMLAAAEASKNEFLISLVRTKIDLTNIITCVRLLRMNMKDSGKALLEGAFLEGGTYDLKFFLDAYDSGEGKLCESLAYSDYGKFISCICENPDRLSNVERFSDNMYMDVVKGTKLISFGPEIPAAYLVAVEYQVKNLRIIIDGKVTGKESEAIRERLRYSYV